MSQQTPFSLTRLRQFQTIAVVVTALALVVYIGWPLTPWGDPCAALERRACADLGSDCQRLRAQGGISLIAPPDVSRHSALSFWDFVPRRHGAWALNKWLFPQEHALCRKFSAQTNYRRVTLPLLRQQLDPHARWPVGSAPQLADDEPTSAFDLRLLPLLLIPAIVIYSVWYRRNRLPSSR